MTFRIYKDGELIYVTTVSSIEEACSLCEPPQPDVEYTLNDVPIWDTFLEDA